MLRAAVFLAALAIPYLVGEGLFALSAWDRPVPSLAYTVYQRLAAGASEAGDPSEPNGRMIHDVAQLEAMLELFRENGIGLGNSPFHELETELSAVNRVQDGCMEQKPDLDKTMLFLRSNLFNPFDQITAFYDAARSLPPEVEAFFHRYGFRKIRHRTNEYGERLTLPERDAPEKVLIAGDSVANGVMLDDAETLASQLQAADRERRYVNLGVAGADGKDVVCALERAARRYAGTVSGLVYVLCENDFLAEDDYADPETLIAWLSDFRRANGVGTLVLVYAPYIYNTMPEITRIRGHAKHDFPTFGDEKRRLFTGARTAGFDVIDMTQLAEQESWREGSRMAPFALYIDHVHLSRRGVALLAPLVAKALGPPRGG